MKQRIVLLGPPASGKGTQADFMHARYHLPITSPGAILGGQLTRRMPLVVEAGRRTSQGQLAPVDLVSSVLDSWLDGQRDSFVFDSHWSAPCPQMKCRDDSPETLKFRVSEYAAKTESLNGCCTEPRIRRTVDAHPTPETVFGAIAEELEAK